MRNLPVKFYKDDPDDGSGYELIENAHRGHIVKRKKDDKFIYIEFWPGPGMHEVSYDCWMKIKSSLGLQELKLIIQQT